MKRGIVDYRIVDEISRKLECLRREHKSIFHLFNNGKQEALKREAIIHSYKIENPGSFQGETINYVCHPSPKLVREGIRNLTGAFNWGMKHFDPKKINPSLIQGITARVDPDAHNHENVADYRDVKAWIKGASWRPPIPSEIKGEMELYCSELRETLKDNNIRAILEASAYAHLHLDRIHPFKDGNGRTARTFQNIILMANDLPPTIIYPGERRDYYLHLQGAIEDWQSNGGHAAIDKSSITTKEREFYDYIAGRVSVSLDRIL